MDLVRRARHLTGATDESPDQPSPANDRTIPVTCAAHSSGRGFWNLRVTKVDDDIVLDPHVTGSCVIVLDETATTVLFDLLGEWPG